MMSSFPPPFFSAPATHARSTAFAFIRSRDPGTKEKADAVLVHRLPFPSPKELAKGSGEFLEVSSKESGNCW
jgi:hypothetical protein